MPNQILRTENATICTFYLQFEIMNFKYDAQLDNNKSMNVKLNELTNSI